MAASQTPQRSHQTTRLGPGRHRGPGDVVCVMELASMLSGERFTDRPASVCPIVGAILRTYNDNVDDARRQDLYRFAADAVGTRGDFPLQRARAAVALEWVQKGASGAGQGARRSLRKPPEEPGTDAGPERIAEYLVASIPRSAIFRPGRGRWSDSIHQAVIELLDDLIAMGNDLVDEPLLGEFVEPGAEPRLETQLEKLLEPRLKPERAPAAHHAHAADERSHVFSIALPDDEPHATEPPAPAPASAQAPASAPAPVPAPARASAPVPASAAGPRPRSRRPRYSRQRIERSAELLGGITLVALACAASRRI